MTIFKHFSESHSFNTKSLFIGHLLQHIRFLFLDDLAIKFKKSIKFSLSKFPILVEQYRLNQMGKIPFFKLSSHLLGVMKSDLPNSTVYRHTGLGPGSCPAACCFHLHGHSFVKVALSGEEDAS